MGDGLSYEADLTGARVADLAPRQRTTNIPGLRSQWSEVTQRGGADTQKFRCTRHARRSTRLLHQRIGDERCFLQNLGGGEQN